MSDTTLPTVTLPAVLAVAVTIAPLITALIICYTFGIQHRFQKRAKFVEVLGDYRKRYDVLLNDTQHRSVDSLARRFWELQLEQYLLWKYGFLPTKDFRFWMARRAVDKNRPLIGGMDMTLLESWQSAKDGLLDPEFLDFIDRVFNDGVESAFAFGEEQRFDDTVKDNAWLISSGIGLALLVAGMFWWLLEP